MKTYYIELVRKIIHQGESCNWYSLLYKSSIKSYKACDQKFKDMVRQYPEDKILFSVDDGHCPMDISITTNGAKNLIGYGKKENEG